MKKARTHLLKLAVSVAFFLFLFRWVRGHDLVQALKNVQPLYFALSLLIVPVLLCTSCAKWKVLLDLQGHKVSFWFLLRTYLIGYFFSNLLPSNFGGDVVRLFYAGRRIGSHGHAAASIFVERFTGVLLLLLLVALAPLLHPSLYASPTVWMPALGALALFAVLVSLVFVKDPFTWVLRTAARLPVLRRFLRPDRPLAQKLHHKLESFQHKLALGVTNLGRSPVAIVKVIVLTVLFYFLAGVNVYLAFSTFGPPPDLVSVISILPTAMIVAMVPITPGGWGLTEGSYVFYFRMLGMLKAHTFAMALFLRLKLILLGLVGYFFYITLKGERFTRSQAAH